ncbi:MAG: amino acid carrier protein [Eubacteriales bacterium]|nr:amino acid carrier protein [Eubacteriales bacterium]MDD3863814.1 amino acid carrier protein [Eubacteriales bacterium]MDD4444342.1 amino acid carrier protein [Eubacteriales bacterium]
MGFFDFIDQANAIVWGPPLMILLLGVGLILTVTTGFFQFRHFGWIMKKTFGSMMQKAGSGEGTISPWEAVTVAVGGAVGAGNIGGVASAIAVGGPGAVFWMWICALVGMLTKCAEVALALHYRQPDIWGDRYIGGPTYYMQKGLGEEKGWGGAYKILAIIFGGGLFIAFFLTMQCYNTAEAINSTFPSVGMVPVAAVYSAMVYLIVWGGLKSVAAYAGKLVPFMCILYTVFALFIIIKNIGQLPTAFALIFTNAFTGTAATGGFAGAAVAVVIQQGLKRALYSNEAGWGSSPMVHATAIVDHPIEQGLWGCFEVFVDTIIVCSMTALTIIVTGLWDSGLSGASLTLAAFETGIGFVGRVIIAVCTFLFALTTSTGWYTYYDTLIRHAFGEDSPTRRTLVFLIKATYALPGFLTVFLTMNSGFGSSRVWGIVDLSTGVPTFANLIAMLFLMKKFLELMKDYKARYMGIGEVDPDFVIWYEDKKKLAAK